MKLRLKEVLKEKGKTMSEVAESIGTKQAALSRAISEDGNPTLSLLQRIATALNVHIADLFEKPLDNDTIGIIRHNGTTYEINSIEDVKRCLNSVDTHIINEVELLDKFVKSVNENYLLKKSHIKDFDSISTNDELAGVIEVIRKILDKQTLQNPIEIDSYFKSSLLIFNNLSSEYWKSIKDGGIIGESYFKPNMDITIDNKQDVINQLLELSNSKQVYNIETRLRGLFFVLNKGLTDLNPDIIKSVCQTLKPLIIKSAILLQ